MRSAKKIRKLFAESRVTVRPEADERISRDALAAAQESKQGTLTLRGAKGWRTIMKSRITKLAAAAVIIIAVSVGISSLSGTSAWAKVISVVKEALYARVAREVAREKAGNPDLKDKPSGPERIRAHHETLQIPEGELASLSTEELLDKITRTPLFVMVITHPHPEPDGGLARFARSYNGVKAFLERPDAGKVLLEQYEKLTNEVFQGVQEKDILFVFRFTIMELLMSSDQVINQLYDPQQRTKVVASIVSALDVQARYDASQPEPVYGEDTLGHTALAAAKYLEALGDPEFKKWYAEKRKADLFASYEESKEVISIARKYVQNQ